MTNPAAAPDLVPGLISTGTALGRLAKDDTLFRAAIDAFRARDGESFQKVLGQIGIDRDCDLICRWIRVKECVLHCIEVCGPPRGDPLGVADIPRFAEIIARIAGDEELVERLADAIEDRDAPAFQRLVGDLEIDRFCHLVCYWACQIHGRLACEVVCAPRAAAPRPFVAELAAAGAAVGALARNRESLAAVIKAGQAVDCEVLSGLVGAEGGCRWICEWVCSWHCVLNCLRLCGPFEFGLDVSLEEVRAFAQACERLAGNPGAVARLVEAVGSENAEAFAALVKELELERFCIQLCHWICFEICRRFCFCVCPNPEALPHWTQVEIFDIHPPAGFVTSSFSAEGYARHPGAGPDTEAYVFGELPGRGGVLLNGNCPLTDTGSGHSLQYRFVIGEWTWTPGPQDDPTTMPSAAPAGPLVPVTQIEQTLVGHVYYPDPLSPQPVYITAADADPQGWIQLNGKVLSVPTFGGPNISVTLSAATFLRADALLLVNSAQITSAHPAKLPGGLPQIQAGRSLTTAEQEPIRRYRLQFEVRDATTLATIYTDTLDSIILSNSPPIVALDLEELLNNLCQPLAGQANAHVLYTVDHPHLRHFDLIIRNNTGTVHPPPAFSGSPTVAMPDGDFAPGGFFFRGGASGPHMGGGTGGVAVDISGDPVCAYAVRLSWSTRQWGDSGTYIEILYCK